MHHGGCHCRKVRWCVKAPKSVVAWQCNCSDCSMRGNIHFIVPSESFELLGDSKEFITTYTFGTHTAKHTFCKVCGITSFYTPRSNPDGVSITLKCVDPGTLAHWEIKNYDGQNWESSYNQTCISSMEPAAESVVLHHGGCHCRRVRWRAEAPSSVVAWECNCSICSMRGTSGFSVPSQNFELLGDSEQFLTAYSFGTHTAKHTFCKVCGVTSSYIPRTGPDRVSIKVSCVDPGTLTHVEVRHFDGTNWERSYHHMWITSRPKVNEVSE